MTIEHTQPDEDFESAWARCSPWLQAALDCDPSHTLDEVKYLVMNNPARVQFWPGESAAVVTEIADYPQYRAFNFWLAGGSFAEMVRGHGSTEAFARTCGCHRMTSLSRLGMLKRMAPLGYRPLYVKMSKELT